jgi:hypothetical protein
MSIINDALKKVQSSLSHGKKTEQTASAAPQDPANQFSDAMPQYTAPAAPETSESAPTPTTTPAAAAAKVTATTKAKESNMVLILGAICLLIALFAPIVNQQSVFSMITNPKKTKSSSITASLTQKSSSASATVAQKAASIKQGLAKSLAGFNASESTAPTVVRSPSGQKIALNGIMAQGSKNVALIDGYVYEAGETVQGIKIVAINATNIVIEENGEQRTLKVGQ